MIMIVLVFVKGPVCWFGQDQPPGPVKITQLAPFHFLGRDHCPTFNSKDVSWQDIFNFFMRNAATYAAAGWLVRSLVLEEEFRTLRNENCYQLCLCTHNHNSHQHHQHWHPDIMKAVIEHCLYKVNRCLARYSPRATTTNRSTNRALNKPAWPGLNWPKLPVLGQIWSFLGKKSFFLLEKSKVLLPT